jgi:GxxExxY protein
MKYSEITEKIIGCAMKVHRELGMGFQEYIYQRALEIELLKAGLKFIREYETPVYYSGEKSAYGKLIFMWKIKLWSS